MTKNTKKHNFKSAVSFILALAISLSLVPVTFAAQSNEYVDPADNWLSSNNRTNELDVNATITNETGYCCVCDKDTAVLTYRVPEYTKTGETALNRGVRYSDGTMINGRDKGNLDNGTPGIDAKYTGYHWTKSVCQICGTINAVDGAGDYSFNNNVYGLNSCDHNFFLDFDSTTYEPHNESKHLTTLKRGEYCKFCKGTFATAKTGLESHNFTADVDAQSGNNRFYISQICDDCGYATSEYVTAKSVVSSYYGTVDESAHTVTVSDLSDNDVHTSIRYGTSAGRCNLTSAPNYTEAGYYPVYYEIDYRYDGKSMTENGVSYVWLLEKDGDTIIVIPPVNSNDTHEHDYHYIETVAPNCSNLGYDRFQCNGCGDLIKTNYTQATGHNYKTVTIREATCKQTGLKIIMCDKCGDFHEETTPLAAHSYKTVRHNPTCRMTGYTEHTCDICGDNYITDITPIISHSFERITKQPTCLDKGYTTATCTMCGFNYVSDYTDPTGHDWDEGHTITNSTCDAEGVVEFNCKNCTEKMIKATDATGHTAGKAATCIEPQVCEKCGTVLELPTGHHYDSEIVEPTCTSMGYTVYTCRDCADSYTGEYTDKSDHDYNTVVTAPTCTQHGYTTYSCKNCDDEYISDYTEKLAHNYTEAVTNSTCTAMGYTTYTCSDCGDNYVGNYTDMLEHNYNKETVEPTCTEHGYAVYTCPDCGKSYIGDYTNCKEHHYTETVIAPTCTEMGYSVFKCDDCGDEYKGNYTDKIEHSYAATVTEPTCLELGFTTFVCSVCGDSYKSEYTEALGHKPTEWIIDTEATIEHAGSKHIECERCGDVLQTVELPQLVDKDHSDEDGNAKVGAFSIILTNKDGQPVFDSEITIDVNDNVTIKLPSGRLLDYADQTTITAFYTDTQEAAQNLRIFIFDENNNAATGATDGNGQLKVPNNQSSTGDDNGTIGSDDGEEKNTFVVTVTDKTNVVIPNCDIHIGESNDIVVDLPDGIKPTRENPVIVTVTDHNSNAQKDITVIAIGDADFMEKGITDIYGKITLPTASEGYTDKDGKVNVDNINVVISDEISVIPNAYVKHNEDNSISVTLPEDKTISYANRITVTVLDSIGNAMPDITVTVNDTAEMTYTANTDDNGVIVVPPLSEDMTDSEGKAVVNGYNVLITDETQPIENAFVAIKDGKISVKLPDGVVISTDNRITATITDKDNAPVKAMSVTFTDSTENSAANLTDENGKAIVPPVNIDYTDANGYAQMIDGENSYNIVVEDTKTKIENAYVEIKDGKISVALPDGKILDTANQTTVTVTDTEAKAVKDVNITVTDKNAKTAAKSTDANGKITVPVKTSTGGGGGSSSGGHGGGSGSSYVKTTYTVKVTDKDGKTVNVNKTVKDDNITLTLPNGVTLKDNNYYTITVTDNKGNAAANVDVTLKDKKDNSVNGITDKNGQIIMPTTEHNSYVVGYEDGAFKPENNMTRAEAAAIFARNIAERKGGNISSRKSSFKDVSNKDWFNNYIAYLEKYKVIAGYNDGTFRPDEQITRAEFVTMCIRFYDLSAKSAAAQKNIFTDVPKTHWAASYIYSAIGMNWINGYSDGTFKPDSNITRAEVVTIVNRVTDREADTEYINKNMSAVNKFTDLKDKAYWAFYEILEASNNHKTVNGKNGETWIK